MAESQLQRWIQERLTARLAEVLESMSGAKVRVTLGGAIESSPNTNELIWRQPFDLAVNEPLWLAAPPEAWKEIGAQSLIAVGVDDADEESIRGTYLEIASQAWSTLGRDFGDRLDRQVSPVDGAEATSWPSSVLTCSVEVQFPGRSSVTLRAGISPGLFAALEVSRPPVAHPSSGSGGAPHPPQPESHASEARPSRTLDLLLDVEMPVSVSFGRLMVPLKDVLKLTSGSVIELNRTVSEPVEIIVNNCVIARGDVVVVEGNYGVRIQNIVNSQERLRTLV